MYAYASDLATLISHTTEDFGRVFVLTGMCFYFHEKRLMFNITQQYTDLNTLLWSNITNFSLKGIKVEQLVTFGKVT